MAQVPDRRDLAFGRRSWAALDARPVVAAAAAIDLGPADRLANHADAEVHRGGVIGSQMPVVAGGGDIVLPLAILPDEGRAFEAGHEEGRKDRSRSLADIARFQVVTRRGLRFLRRSPDERPAVAPLDPVDQQDSAAVDLVLLALARAVHVDRMVDDPRLPGLVGHDAIVPRREPALALEQHQAVRHAARLLERFERPRRLARARDHHAIIGVRPATIVARVEEVIKIAVADHPARPRRASERRL